MSLTFGIAHSVRHKATRFPGKVLKPLLDGNVTQFLLRRLHMVRGAEAVILATSTDPRDDVLAEIAAQEGAIAFRGSPEDKLMRYRDAARRHGLDYVVVVDGDDPFVSVEHIDAVIDHVRGAHDTAPIDLCLYDGLPLGAAGFCVSTRGLETICAEREESDTEVWGALFFDDARFHCVKLPETNPAWNKPSVRMTLDFPEDYAFFRTVAEGVAAHGVYPSFPAVMDYIAAHPDVTQINQGVQAAYEAHLNKSTRT